MKHQLWLIAAGVLLAAGPATGQDNAIAPPEANVVNATNDSVSADTNLVATNMVVETEPALPPTTDVAGDVADDDRDESRGFPWGLIGLVGLIGLLGRRRHES